MNLFVVDKDLKHLNSKSFYTGTYFGVCTDQFESVLEVGACKEYTLDVYYTTITGQSSVKIPQLKVPFQDLRITAINSNKNYLNVLSLLHKMEELFCIQKTVIQTDKKENIYVFNHAPEWHSCAPMLSLYTLLIRLGFQSYKLESDAISFLQNEQTEEYILKCGMVGIEFLLNGGLKFFKEKDIEKNWINWNKYVIPASYYNIRLHDSGIRSFGNYLKENRITCLEQLI